MTPKKRKIIIIIASAVLVCALAAAAFFIMLDKGVFSKGAPDASDETTHADEEVVYDDDGSVKSRVYYKDGEYDGRTDYYSKDGIDYEMRYNSAGEEIASRKTEHNALGSVTVDQKRENGEITELSEYTYYDDMTTLKKLVTKTYDADGSESAEKLFYDEGGTVVRRVKYENGESISDETYAPDASGANDE